MSKKLAIVIPPMTNISGGASMLFFIGEIYSDVYKVDYVHVINKRLSLRYILKLIYSKLKHPEIKLIRPSKVNLYDHIVVSWVSDVANLIDHVESEKITHYCQSLEYWSGNHVDCFKSYETSLNRLFVADWMVDYTKNKRSAVVYNFIEDNFFNNKEIKEKKWITYLTHPGFWKNCTENQVLANILGNCTEYQIKKIGSYKLKKVDRITSREAILEILKETSVFISLSIYEGLPLMVLEAIGAGAKVILSDIPSHREISKLFDENTVLLIKTTPLLYTDTIKAFIDKPINLEANRRLIISHFSKATFKERLNDVKIL